MGTVVEKLYGIIEEVASQSGFELVDLRVAAKKVSVFIDRPGGVNIGQCARLSREIGVMMDVEGVMGNSYNLEVSSPGVERPLKKPEDYERFSGKRAKVRTADGVFIGRIEGADGGFVRMSVEDANEGLSIPFESIEKANLQREI